MDDASSSLLWGRGEMILLWYVAILLFGVDVIVIVIGAASAFGGSAASKTLKSKSFGEFLYRPTVPSIAKLSQLSRLAVCGFD